MASAAKVVQLRQDAPADPAAAERAAETKLLERVRDEGDREAFSELFAAFTPRLTAWVANQGCDTGMAENVVQDVMITAWTRARLFDARKASARTWIYTLARNRMIDHHRSNSRRARAHDEFASLAPATETDKENPEHGVTRDRLSKMLDQLPPEQRQILLLVYVEGHSHRDIANQLGLPVGTVKSRTRLAFQRLRKLMEQQA
ncbi:MAG: RNA polymerase sigma factor [Gammaproteobacteria bacterium]